MYNFAAELAEHHDVEVVAIARTNEIARQPGDIFEDYHVFAQNRFRFYARGVLSLFSRKPIQSGVFFSRTVAEWVDSNLDRFDLVFCFRIAMAPYVEDRACTKVIDLVDAVSESYSEFFKEASFPWNVIYRIESRRAANYEHEVAETFDRTYITTETDGRFIGDQRIRAIPNGVSADLLDYERTFGTEPRIAFLGDMSTLANEKSVLWFADSILPRIIDEVPDITLDVIGKSPSKEVRSLESRDRISISGFVDDPHDRLRRARVSVAPIKIGGGIQNKILESMALGVPVTTTRLGAEGIAGEDGVHLLISTDESSFATDVVRLLQDDSLARQLSQNGRELIRSTYSWERIGEELNEDIAGLLES